MNVLTPLTHEQIARVAPSVFATQPYSEVSDRYSFIPTHSIVERLAAEGIVPVSARQSRAKAERREFTRHELRFVRESQRAIMPAA